VGPVDLNADPAGRLESLPGVGPATAAAIIEWRDQHGPFVVVDDLLDVPGIGPAKLAAIRDLVEV
jgi:competence protein ComEA